jgi:hypothetical protein
MKTSKPKPTGVPEIDRLVTDVASMVEAYVIFLCGHHPATARALLADRARVVRMLQATITKNLYRYARATGGRTHATQRFSRPHRHGEKKEHRDAREE